jgi:cysteine sulfinate desulfinase/cysteine desulfurase-like protein
VLRAMGLEGEDLYGAVRVSFGRDHTRAKVSADFNRGLRWIN